MKSVIAAAAALAAAGVGCVCDGRDVVVSDDNGAVVMAVCAEVAVTEAARSEGLTGRAPLQPDEGLLLPLLAEGDVCVDNVDVDFAIDVVFVDGDDRVSAVARDVAAGDEALHCADAAIAIVEVAAGVADSVEVGQVVRGLEG